MYKRQVFSNQLKANLVYVDVTDRFLNKLAGVEDPEQKRKIIGGEFIRVFEEEARKLNGIDFLGQGTISVSYTHLFGSYLSLHNLNYSY